MNMCVQVFVGTEVFLSLGSMSKGEIAGLNGNCMFSFRRVCQTIFQSGWTILHSHQQCMSLSASSPSFRVVVIFYFNQPDRCVFIVVLICISIMMNDAEHPFMSLLAICRSSSGRRMGMSFAHFLIGLFFFLLFHFESSLYIPGTSPLSDVWLVDIFFQGGTYLSLLFTRSHTEQKFSF